MNKNYLWWFRSKICHHPYLVIKSILDSYNLSGYKIKHKYSNSFIRKRDPHMDLFNNTYLSKSWKEKSKRRNQYK